MMETIRVAGAQLDLTVGDLDGNRQRILDAMAWAELQQADVLLLPELAVTGYPPEDLVLRPAFIDANLAIVEELAAESGDTTTVVGFLDRVESQPDSGDAMPRSVANAAALIGGGRVLGRYHKVLLPNYGVFDEERYFVVGDEPARTWTIGPAEVGVSVCEDIWLESGPPTMQAEAGASILLNINGSPYHRGKFEQRAELLRRQAVLSATPVVYLNCVGGQDELVFDGDSMVFDHTGALLHRAAAFEEELFVVDVPLSGGGSGDPAQRPEKPQIPAAHIREEFPSEEAEVYRALVTGLRDYVRKNGFSQVIIGLSGGIDSGLCAALAADALGPENVWGVSMPSRFSSEGSVLDSKDLADRLGIRFDVIPVERVFSAYLETLAPQFGDAEFGVAEENLQARVRGAILMALSNKHGGIVVATGNKSEMAVGYATLYGDMAGGYAILKDVLKTLVYRLARWRNTVDEAIPVPIIVKPPSAELRPDQKDSDSLPEYDVLDPILEAYVEADRSVASIIAEGHPADVVTRVARLVDRNEYKRRQAAPGVKITEKAFGRDRRLPITNHFRR